MATFTLPTHTDCYGDFYLITHVECLIWNSFRLCWVFYATLEEASQMALKSYTTN